MTTLQQKITDKFIQKLSESKNIDDGKIKKLRNLLLDNKKPKTEDLIKIFSSPVGDISSD